MVSQPARMFQRRNQPGDNVGTQVMYVKNNLSYLPRRDHWRQQGIWELGLEGGHSALSIEDGEEEGVAGTSQSFLLYPNSRTRSQTLPLNYAENTFPSRTLKRNANIQDTLQNRARKKILRRQMGRIITGKVSLLSTQGLPLPEPLLQFSGPTRSHLAPHSQHRLWEKVATGNHGDRSPTTWDQHLWCLSLYLTAKRKSFWTLRIIFIIVHL